MTVVAKLDPAARDSAPSFRNAVLTVDRSQPVYNIRTMRQVVIFFLFVLPIAIY